MLDFNKEEKYQQLFAELESYEEKGIPISIEAEEEQQVSPQQVVETIMVRENMSLMREYILNSKGNIEKIVFHKIK